MPYSAHIVTIPSAYQIGAVDGLAVHWPDKQTKYFVPFKGGRIAFLIPLDHARVLVCGTDHHSQLAVVDTETCEVVSVESHHGDVKTLFASTDMSKLYMLGERRSLMELDASSLRTLASIDAIVWQGDRGKIFSTSQFYEPDLRYRPRGGDPRVFHSPEKRDEYVRMESSISVGNFCKPIIPFSDGRIYIGLMEDSCVTICEINLKTSEIFRDLPRAVVSSVVASFPRLEGMRWTNSVRDADGNFEAFARRSIANKVEIRDWDAGSCGAAFDRIASDLQANCRSMTRWDHLIFRFTVGKQEFDEFEFFSEVIARKLDVANSLKRVLLTYFKVSNGHPWALDGAAALSQFMRALIHLSPDEFDVLMEFLDGLDHEHEGYCNNTLLPEYLRAHGWRSLKTFEFFIDYNTRSGGWWGDGDSMGLMTAASKQLAVDQFIDLILVRVDGMNLSSSRHGDKFLDSVLFCLLVWTAKNDGTWGLNVIRRMRARLPDQMENWTKNVLPWYQPR